MGKVIKHITIVQACDQCYFAYEPPTGYWLCTQCNPNKIIKDLDNIPEWCPLEDAHED